MLSRYFSIIISNTKIEGNIEQNHYLYVEVCIKHYVSMTKGMCVVFGHQYHCISKNNLAKVVYKNIVNLANIYIYIDIYEIRGNNEKHKINFYAYAIQYIVV